MSKYLVLPKVARPTYDDESNATREALNRANAGMECEIWQLVASYTASPRYKDPAILEALDER